MRGEAAEAVVETYLFKEKKGLPGTKHIQAESLHMSLHVTAFVWLKIGSKWKLLNQNTIRWSP